MAKHDKVTPGTYTAHEDGQKECDECFRPPAIKLYLDDADTVRGISRTFFCSDKPVSFSIGLMVFSTVRRMEVDVIRACSSHANYHMHHWHHLKGGESHVNEMYPLDSQDDLMKAHAHASANVFPRYQEWRKEWNKKK